MEEFGTPDNVNFAFELTQGGGVNINGSISLDKSAFAIFPITEEVESDVEEAGLNVETVFKVNEGRPNIVDFIKRGEIALVINTPLGSVSHFDEQAIVLAALLHDVGDKKYLKPGEVAETMITAVLQQNGCPARLMSKVALIVEHVSFSSEIKRPQLVKAMVTAHPELGIVQDADRLDAIGAVGIARCFAFGGAKASGRGLHGCIEHFTDKLENLQDMMKTETGRRLAEERTRRLREFRGWWDEENAGLS